MPEYLIAMAAVVLATVALGLVRILRGPADVDRMMAAQLIGTGGIAVLLLGSTGAALPAAVDGALTLALLAAFASIAFVKKGTAQALSDDDATTAGTADVPGTADAERGR